MKGGEGNGVSCYWMRGGGSGTSVAEVGTGDCNGTGIGEWTRDRGQASAERSLLLPFFLLVFISLALLAPSDHSQLRPAFSASSPRPGHTSLTPPRPLCLEQSRPKPPSSARQTINASLSPLFRSYRTSIRPQQLNRRVLEQSDWAEHGGRVRAGGWLNDNGGERTKWISAVGKARTLRGDILTAGSPSAGPSVELPVDVPAIFPRLVPACFLLFPVDCCFRSSSPSQLSVGVRVRCAT